MTLAEATNIVIGLGVMVCLVRIAWLVEDIRDALRALKSA